MSAANLKMFGCSIEALCASVEQYVAYQQDEPMRARLMLVMSMLSDSQEQLERGQNEQARQTINRAKYVISDVRDDMRLATLREANPHRKEA